MLSLKSFFKFIGKKEPTCKNVFFWLVGIFILIALTIKDIYPLVDEYQSNNIVALIKVVARNKTIKPPALTLCIPRKPAALSNIATYLTESPEKFKKCNECSKLSNKSWDVWNESDFSKSNTTEDLRGMLSAALSKKLLIDGIENDFAALSIDNSDWNQPLVEAALDLFDCITELDTNINAPAANNETWNLDCSGKHDINRALKSSYHLEKLYTRIVEFMCRQLKFGNSEQTCRAIFDSQPSATAYANYFCFAIPMLEKGTHLSFTFNSQTSTDLPIEVHADTRILTWMLGGTNDYTGELDLLLLSETSPQSAAIKEFILLKYLVFSSVNEKRQNVPCFTDSTPSVCKGNCVLAKIVKKCQCVPFTFRKNAAATMQQKLPYCNSTHYIDCRLNVSLVNENCKIKCDSPCEYVFYQWHTSRTLKPNSQRMFNLLITPVYSPFLDFAVTTKNSPEQFLSQMAAFFNLYLGFSGLSVVALVVLVADAASKWYQSINGNQIDDRNSREINSIFALRSMNTMRDVDFRKEFQEAMVKLNNQMEQWRKLQESTNDELKKQMNTLTKIVQENSKR